MKRARVIAICCSLVVLLLGSIFSARFFPVDPIDRLEKRLRTRNSALDTLWDKVWRGLPDWFVTTFRLPPPANVDEIRRAACVELALLGSVASNAVPALVEALDSSSSSVRLAAIDALSRIGPAARDAVPALVKLRSDADWMVRQKAIESLWQLGAD